MHGSRACLHSYRRHHEMGLAMDTVFSGVMTPEELAELKGRSSHQEPKEAVVRLLAPSGGNAPNSIIVRCPIELRGTFEKWLVGIGNKNHWDATVKSWLE